MARRRQRPAYGTVRESFFAHVRQRGIEATGSPMEVLLYLHVAGRQFGPPGLYGLDALMIAHSLRCPAEAVEWSLRALEDAGLVRYDADAGVIHVHGGVADDWPGTPKNIEGYRRPFDRVPRSALDADWLCELRKFAIERGFDCKQKVSGKYESHEDTDGSPVPVPGWLIPGFEDVETEPGDCVPPGRNANAECTVSEHCADGAGTPPVPQSQSHNHSPDPSPETTSTPFASELNGAGALQQEGVRKSRVGGIPRSLIGIGLDELEDPDLLWKRYRRLVADGVVESDSQANWLTVATVAMYAMRKGDSPGAVFAKMVRDGTRFGLTNKDEDAAQAFILSRWGVLWPSPQRQEAGA